MTLEILGCGVEAKGRERDVLELGVPRLRGLEGYFISRSLVRMHAAALPAALLAVLADILTGNAFVVVVIGGGLAGTMYLLFARALRVDELTGLIQSMRARLGH